MKKKKNRFLLFCFSFLPGAGEMYYGLMKTGVSLLSIFAISVMLASYTGIGVIMFIPGVIWIYSFFHANNMGALSDEVFDRLEDNYLFGFSEREFGSIKTSIVEKYRKALAIILILLGITMLWQSFCRMLRHFLGNDFYYAYIARFTGIVSDDIPRVIVALVIVWFGFKLIRGKKEELDKLEDGREQVSPSGNTADTKWNAPGAGFGTKGAERNTADSADNAGSTVPVERIEQVEVVDNITENNEDAH